jgi:hypothetical protein
MLHARIHTAHDAFHFIAEVTSYNLQTLRQHLRQSVREGAHVTVSLQIDARDELDFARYTAAWLPDLIEAGINVEMDIGAALPTTVARTGAVARQSRRDPTRSDRR